MTRIALFSSLVWACTISQSTAFLQRSHQSWIPHQPTRVPFQFPLLVAAQRPKPPSIPPPSNEEFYIKTLQEKEDVANAVHLLQRRVATLESELSEKQEALQSQTIKFAAEKGELQGQLDVITQSVIGEGMDDDVLQEKDRLEREVEVLQGQLPQIQNLLKSEQRRSQELEEKIADYDYTLEYQQMEFEKLQESLKNELEEEKSKLRRLEQAIENKDIAFEATTSSSQKELEDELARMQASRASLQTNQVQFAKEKERLTKALTDQKASLASTKKELEEQQDMYASEKEALQQEIIQEQEKLETAETFLKESQDLYEVMEKELKEQLDREQAKVEELSSQLAKEQREFTEAKEEIQSQMQKEQTKVVVLEQQLYSERFQNNKKMKKLESTLEDEVRSRRHAKEKMAERYSEIRREMTALWQGAQQEGRENVKRLEEKYEGVVTDLRASVKSLESSVQNLTTERNSLSEKLAELEKERDLAQQQRKILESRYEALLSGKNKEIAALKSELRLVSEKMATSEREVAEIRTSWRALVKATLKLTGKRLLTPVTFVGRRLHKD